MVARTLTPENASPMQLLLAAAYAPVDDVVAQAAELLAELEAGRLPPPRYPAYWQVAVNDHVARSLNIVISPSVRALGERPSGSR